MSHPWRGGSGFAISPFPPPDPPVSVGESSPGHSLDAPTVPEELQATATELVVSRRPLNVGVHDEDFILEMDDELLT